METFFNGFMNAIRTSVLEGANTLHILDSSGGFMTYVVSNLSISLRGPFRHGTLSFTTTSTDIATTLANRMQDTGSTYELYVPVDSSQPNCYHHLKRCFPVSISTSWGAAQDLYSDIEFCFNELTMVDSWEAVRLSRRAFIAREVPYEPTRICWKKYGF